MPAQRCVRYPCDKAYRQLTHRGETPTHTVGVGEGKYWGPHDYAWSVDVVAIGDDGEWLLRLRVGETYVDLQAGEEAQDLVKHITRAAMWQGKFLREDLQQKLDTAETVLADLERSES